MTQSTKPILATPLTPCNVPAAAQPPAHPPGSQNSPPIYNIALGILDRQASHKRPRGNAEPWRRDARQIENQLINLESTGNAQDPENVHQVKRCFAFASVFHDGLFDRIVCLQHVIQECHIEKKWLDALSTCQEVESLLELLVKKQLNQTTSSSWISWREVASRYPEFYISTLLIRAICYMKTQNYAQGLMGFQEAFLKTPYEVPQNDRLHIRMFMKNSILALKEYEELDPGSTLLIQGEYYLRLNDFNQAYEVLFAALELDEEIPAPSHQQLYALAKRLLHNGKQHKREDLLDMASGYFDWALDRPMIPTERNNTLLGLYHAYQNLQQFPEALRILKLFTFSDDQNPELWIALAHCYQKLEDIPHALDAFRKAYELGRHASYDKAKSSLLEISLLIKSLDPELAEKYQEWASSVTRTGVSS